MLKEADIIKHIKSHLSEGDELVSYFFAKINPNFLVLYMTGAFAGVMFEPFFVAITKRGFTLYRINKLATKFLDYHSFNFVDIDSISFGWGIIERSIKIILKDGNQVKMNAMAMGKGDRKLTSDLEKYIKNKIIEINRV